MSARYSRGNATEEKNDDGTEAGNTAPQAEKEKGREAPPERSGKEIGGPYRGRAVRTSRCAVDRGVPLGRKRMGRWWPPRTSNPVGRQQCLRRVRFPRASASLFHPSCKYLSIVSYDFFRGGGSSGTRSSSAGRSRTVSRSPRSSGTRRFSSCPPRGRRPRLSPPPRGPRG